MESCTTLLSNDLKRHLFNLFASWSGPTAKPLSGQAGNNSGGGGSNANTNTNTGNSTTAVSGSSASVGNVCAEEEKLQLGALQVSIFC